MKSFARKLAVLAAFAIPLLGQPALAQPGPSTTGPKSADSQLRQISGTTITQDGTVLEGVFISGTLTIKANNVTVRNFKLSSSSHYGINASFGYKNLTIEDGEIYGPQSAAVYGGNFTARRLNIHDIGNDGFKPTGNAVIEDNWIRRLGYISDSHADGVQMVAGSNVVIRGNYFDMPAGLPGFNNSICMIIQTDDGPINDILIENNWINGGGYSIQIRDKNKGYGAPTNVRIINNRFGRDFQYGPWVTDGNVVKSGNVWDDTGALLTGQTAGGGTPAPTPSEPSQASAPRFSIAGGNFLQPQVVSLSSATSGAKIHYTLDGSTPTTSSPSYSTPLTLSSTTMVKAIAVASGLSASPVSSQRYVFNTFTSSDEWSNLTLPASAKTLRIGFDATVSQPNVDSVIGLSRGAAGAFTHLGPILRFAPSGIIDARNGGSYTSAATLNYSAGVKYRVDLSIDIEKRTYSATVTPPGGNPVRIADNFAFRSEQASLTQLDNLGFNSSGGTTTISNVTLGDVPKPMPPRALRFD